MDWAQIQTWPNAHLSRRITGPVHRWHVQDTGEGDLILLLHGAGASTHSWRDLIPLLAQTHRVVALDLPGHGFTQLGARNRSGLPHMTEDVLALCAQENWQPVAIIGHSAGCTVALQMARTMLSPRGQAPKVVGINAALGTFKGVAGVLFPIMAKMLAAMPFTATLFSGASARPERVKSLIDSTGSTLTPEGLDLYRRLVGDRAHVDGALKMMAQWDLTALLDSLDQITAQTCLIVGDRDSTVPPDVAQQAAGRMPDARVVTIEGAGHLVHEEKPAEVAGLIQAFLAD